MHILICTRCGQEHLDAAMSLCSRCSGPLATEEQMRAVLGSNWADHFIKRPVEPPVQRHLTELESNFRWYSAIDSLRQCETPGRDFEMASGTFKIAFLKALQEEQTEMVAKVQDILSRIPDKEETH